jgi:hypothetical protein
MTGFMVVDGAMQHGLSITGTLLILVLFTTYFLLMFICSHFVPDFASCRCNLGPGPALLVDVVQSEGLAEVLALGTESAHMIANAASTMR